MTDDVLKWTATALLIVGQLVTSLNIYPLGIILLIIGGMTWLVVSIRWREPSMIATNSFMTLAALAGLAWHYLS